MARYARMLILFVAGVFAVGMLPQANAQVSSASDIGVTIITTTTTGMDTATIASPIASEEF